MWTQKDIQEAGSLGLWLLLGLHKGFLGEQTKVTGAHTDKEQHETFRFFYLGRDDMVGFVDNYHRRTLPAHNYVTQDWYEKLGGMSPHAAWEGPEMLPTSSVLAGNRLRAEALPVLAELNGGTFSKKPKIKLPPKQLEIDYEDRPDVGTEWVPPPKPKFKLKKPSPFKLKRRT